MYQKIIVFVIIIIAVVLFVRIFVKKLKSGNDCYKSGGAKSKPNSCDSCECSDCPLMRKKRK